VRQAFADQHVAPPVYWIARYDRDPRWGDNWAALGCVAKQYLGDTNGMDYSSVADHWPGVDSAGGGGNVTQEDHVDDADVRKIWTMEAVVQDQIDKNDWLAPGKMLAYVKYDTFYMNQKLDKVLGLLAKQSGVTGAEIADALKADFIATTKEIATDVAHLDEEAVARKLDEYLAARIARMTQP